MIPNDKDEFLEYKRLFVHEITELNKEVKEITKMIIELREDVIVLKQKAWFFGGLAGVIVSVGLILLERLIDR